MTMFEDVKIALQYLLPGHLLSRTVGQLALCEIPAVKNRLIHLAIQRFKIDLADAEISDPEGYPHFNAFFTRALKANARTLAGADWVTSPADGCLYQAGHITEDGTLRAKGHEFTVDSLLGHSDDTTTFIGGEFVTVYLSPQDYHRVHMPMDWELKRMIHVPGRLFSVNTTTTDRIPGVFARNERVVLHFKTGHGPFVMVLVGAMLVASIETTWAGIVTPPGISISDWRYHSGSKHSFKQGDEIGRFRFRSTVILMVPKQIGAALSALQPGRAVKMGEGLAALPKTAT